MSRKVRAAGLHAGVVAEIPVNGHFHGCKLDVVWIENGVAFLANECRGYVQDERPGFPCPPGAEVHAARAGWHEVPVFWKVGESRPLRRRIVRQLHPNQHQVGWYDPGEVHESLQCCDGDRAARVDDGRSGVVPASAVLAGACPEPVERVGAPRDSPDDGTRHYKVPP